MSGPVTGDVDPIDPGTHPLQVGGASDTQNTPVSIFVLNPPFNVASPSWAAPIVVNTSITNSGTASDPWFTWGKPVTPLASQWPRGGLLRVRASSAYHGSGTVADMATFDSYVFDKTGTSCLNTELASGATWGAAGSACRSSYAIANMATVVSTFTTPSAESGDVINYLGKRGNLSSVPATSIPSASKDFSDNYYNSIGAPATLALFVSTYGFPAGEVHALYYNMGDLGIGRDMHCKSFTPPGYPASSGKVCYVTNYGRVNNVVAKFAPAFGSLPTQTVITQAEAGTAAGPVTNLGGDETASSANIPVATVAMIYNPAQATDNPVQFIVYNSDGVLSEYAALDNPGVVANSKVTKVINGVTTTVDHRDLAAAANLTVPNNCLTCHGTSSTYTPKHTTGSGSGHAQITKATFLPFDLEAIVFSTETTGQFTAPLMTTAVKSLNAIVYDSAPTPAVTALLKGMYPSATSDGPSCPRPGRPAARPPRRFTTRS
jgi:hypothetical protein